MQAERAGLRTENSQKTTCKDQEMSIKKSKEKTWQQQEDVFCNLRNFEKVKSKLEKVDFHYVVSYFKPILKEFCTKHYSQ